LTTIHTFDYSTTFYYSTTTMTTSTDAALQAAVAAMHQPGNLFDVTIICTGDDHQAAYWMDKLQAGVFAHSSSTTTTTTSSTAKHFPMVLAVSEDWNGSSGAGNGLGTLYAFQKAHALAQLKFGVDNNNMDLTALLQEGAISVALYHTAGKGTRLAPLPAAENNNKPGVVRIITLHTYIHTYNMLYVFVRVPSLTS
jgi:hypothetical protein